MSRSGGTAGFCTRHESTQVGAGMSYVRGAVHTEEGELIASFAQDALIRPLRTTDTAIKEQSRL